jgi:hypothetical protein
MRNLLLLVFFLLGFSFRPLACDCPALPAANENYFNKFELIFKGKVISVGECKDVGSARVKLSQLFKGMCTEEVDIYFDCSTDCMMSFAPGEEWIFYANFFQHGKPRVEFCSRSRKFNANENRNNAEFVSSDLSFQEENELLKSQLGLHHFLKENENASLTHQNQRPSGTTTIILVISSIVVLIVFYYLFTKYFK